jgi:hypothetical protein
MHTRLFLCGTLALSLHCAADGTADDSFAENATERATDLVDAGSPPFADAAHHTVRDARPPLTAGDGGGQPAVPSMITVIGVTNAHDNNQTINALSVNLPPGTASGDLLVAAIYLGNDALSSLPNFTSPAGFTLVDQTNRLSRGSLLVELHVAGPSEPASYTWQSDAPVYAVGWIAAYRGVNVADPVDAHVGSVNAYASATYAVPTATTTVPNALLVASFAGWTSTMGASTWTCPPTVLANPNDGRERSGCGGGLIQVTPGATVPLSASVSRSQDYALTHLLALKPAH